MNDNLSAMKRPGVIWDWLAAIWRSAARDRSYVAINLAGLALGFACCLVLGLFLRSELTYAQHFDNHSRIYRLAGDFSSATSSTQGVYRRAAVTARRARRSSGHAAP